MQKSNLLEKGDNSKFSSWIRCYKPNNCTLLKDGKIYQCSTCANSSYLNNMFKKDFVISTNDFLNLDDVTEKQQIDKFLTKPIDFCRYCNLKKIENVGWKVSEKNEFEWLIK
jgi:hypothetical protein